MDKLKSFTFCLCIATLLFAIIRLLIPNQKYEKYMRMAMHLIFIILVLQGITDLSNNVDLKLTDEMEITATDTLEQLRLSTIRYVDSSLQSAGYRNSYCDDIDMIRENNQYLILSVKVKSHNENTENLKKYISEMCGIQEDHIYVESG